MQAAVVILSKLNLLQSWDAILLQDLTLIINTNILYVVCASSRGLLDANFSVDELARQLLLPVSQLLKYKPGNDSGKLELKEAMPL